MQATSVQGEALPFTAETWPHITFIESGLTTLANIRNLLANTDGAGHPKAREIRKEFMDRMDYLDGYGGPVSETDTRRRFKVTLRGSGALDPYDFEVLWQALKPDGNYEFFMYGALVCHGVPGPFKPVTLEPCWWGIHT